MVRTPNGIFVFLLVSILQSNHCNHRPICCKTLQSVMQKTYKQLKWKCAKLFWTRWQRSAAEPNAFSLCLKFLYSIIRLEMRATLLKCALFGLTTFSINIRYILHLRAALFFYRRRYFLHIFSIFLYVFCKWARELYQCTQVFTWCVCCFCPVLPENEICRQNLEK